MAQSILDSIVYGGLWTRAALHDVFDEVPRTRDWLEILAVLAEVQADYGLIPVQAAREVAATCRSIEVDAAFLESVRVGREASGHSTEGLIRAVRERCPGDTGEWLYYGATVQDLTDTWLMRALQHSRLLLGADLASIDDTLVRLALRHRDTPMLGRTHGQPGLPITFGFKAAGWLAELRRHQGRLREAAARMDVGQLCGGVGSVASQGPQALEIQARFCERLQLRAPTGSWTASRDVIAEWCNLLALVCATGDRIGQEVYNLQRSEIGELSEGVAAGTVGSITMPHKRNPEIAEHLGSLARSVRHLAAGVTEGLVHDHERDGRAWKGEWHAVPECTLMAGRAVELLRDMLAHLQVHPERMLENLRAAGGSAQSEALMLALAPALGRLSAHRLVYDLALQARGQGLDLEAVARASVEVTRHLDPGALDSVFSWRGSLGQCGALVDRLIASEAAP